jgi:hypothetical protein
MYTVIASFSTQLFFTHHYNYIHTWRDFFALFSASPCSPCCPFFTSPLYPFSTYLAPSSCDRNRPPSSQVACKLTLFAPPFTQLSHPFQFPRTPTAQRLTTTTLGPLRSGYAEHLPLPFPTHFTIHFFLVHFHLNACLFAPSLFCSVPFLLSWFFSSLLDILLSCFLPIPSFVILPFPLRFSLSKLFFPPFLTLGPFP